MMTSIKIFGKYQLKLQMYIFRQEWVLCSVETTCVVLVSESRNSGTSQLFESILLLYVKNLSNFI